MHLRSFLLITVCYLLFIHAVHAQRSTAVIELEGTLTTDLNKVVGSTCSLYDVLADMKNVKQWPPSKTDKGYIWKIALDTPTMLTINGISGINRTFLVEPGDSVSGQRINSRYRFTGAGAAKYNLIMEAEERSLPERFDTRNRTAIKDYVQHYLDLSHCVDSLILERTALLERFKPHLTPLAYRVLSTELLIEPNYSRAREFCLSISANKQKEFPADIKCLLYDTTIANKDFTHRAFTDKESLAWETEFYLLTLNSLKSSRKRMFGEEDKEGLNLAVKDFQFAEQMTSGLARERLLTRLLKSFLIKRYGLNEKVLACVDAYLKLPGYPAYKQWMRDIVAEKRNAFGQPAPNFTLVNNKGNKVSLADFRGKWVLLDFWFTGCKGCIDMVPALQNVEDAFRDESNLAFLHISIDRNQQQWLNSIAKGKYTVPTGIQLYTGSKQGREDVAAAYQVTSFPTLILVGPDGKLYGSPPPDPREDHGEALIKLLGYEISKLADGPYVGYTDGAVTVYSREIKEGKLLLKKESVPLSEKEKLVLQVGTSTYGKKFPVTLKDKLQVEPHTFPMPEKLFAVSDIEGNFEAFANLLQGGGVIDSSFNWAFGKGHLVLVGDFFDRGSQVTEVLWLIYALEQQAKLAGGYVHYILGNHELMALSGNTRYTAPKYLEMTNAMGVTYRELFAESTELGKWLRTKNVAEKIGDILFVHGGIAPEVNRMDISLDKLNKAIRPFYGASNAQVKLLTDSNLVKLLNSKTSPFWYRFYYKNTTLYADGTMRYKITDPQVDTTLNKFDVRHIVTGHTVVADTISTWFSQKVINIDTHHATSKSEALLVTDDKFYRVDTVGTKRELFRRSFEGKQHGRQRGFYSAGKMH